jgi:hypothetical protein
MTLRPGSGGGGRSVAMVVALQPRSLSMWWMRRKASHFAPLTRSRQPADRVTMVYRGVDGSCLGTSSCAAASHAAEHICESVEHGRSLAAAGPLDWRRAGAGSRANIVRRAGGQSNNAVKPGRPGGCRA